MTSDAYSVVEVSAYKVCRFLIMGPDRMQRMISLDLKVHNIGDAREDTTNAATAGARLGANCRRYSMQNDWRMLQRPVRISLLSIVKPVLPTMRASSAPPVPRRVHFSKHHL